MENWLNTNLLNINEDDLKKIQLNIKSAFTKNDFLKYFPIRKTETGEQIEYNSISKNTLHRLTFRTDIRKNLLNYIDIEIHIRNNGNFEAEIWFVHQSAFMQNLIDVENCLKQCNSTDTNKDRYVYIFKMSDTLIDNFCQILINELKTNSEMTVYEEIFNLLKYDLTRNRVFDILPLQQTDSSQQIEPKKGRVVIRFRSPNILKINAITIQKRYNKFYPRIYFNTTQISELQSLSKKFKSLGLHKISGKHFSFVNEEYNEDFIINFKQVLIENGYNSALHEEFMNPNANFDSFFDELPDNLEDALTLTRRTDQELYQLASKYGIKESLQENFIIFYDKLWNLYLKKADIDFCSDTNILNWDNIVFLISHTQNIEKLEITSKFYKSQLVAAAEIFINWLHGCNFVHIAANPQEGKTGTVESLINLIAFHFHRFFWIPSWCNFDTDKVCLYTTGVPYKQLNEQLRKISESFAFIKYMGQNISMPSKIKYRKKYDLHNLINNIENTTSYEEFIYLVLDEDHYGQARNSMVDRELLQSQVVNYLSEQHIDKKLLSLSATGYATISTIIENKELNGAVVTLPENYNYEGPKFALQHLTDINKEFDNGETEESIIINRISNAIEKRRYGLYIFRTPRQIDEYISKLNRQFGDLIDVEIMPYNQANNSTLEILKGYDQKHLNKVFVILIDRLFSLGTDAEHLKEHIRLIYDKSNNNIAQVMQSIGRAFGYHNNNDIEFICNKHAVEAHILINTTAGDILNNPFFVNEFNQAGFRLETNFSKKTKAENVTIATGLTAKVFSNDDILQNKHDNFISQFDDAEYASNFLKQSLIKNISTTNTNSTWIITRRASRTQIDIPHWENYYKKFVDDIENRIKNPTFLHHILKRNNAAEHHRRRYFLDNINKGIIAIFIDKNEKFSDDYNQNYAEQVILVKSTNNEIIEQEQFTEFAIDNKKGELWND